MSEAWERFHKMKRPEDEHPDLRGVIYGTVAREGKSPDFDKLVGMHNKSSNSEQRVTLAGALTGFQQPELLDRAKADAAQAKHDPRRGPKN